MTQRFEWDETKAATNLRKHGMSFEEAASVFSEALAYTFADPEGSWGQRVMGSGLSMSYLYRPYLAHLAVSRRYQLHIRALASVVSNSIGSGLSFMHCALLLRIPNSPTGSKKHT